jgi:hypothetical protein
MSKWLEVLYYPGEIDAFGFKLHFDTAPPGHEEVSFGLGPDEMEELWQAMLRARQERALALSQHDRSLDEIRASIDRSETEVREWVASEKARNEENKDDG